VIPVPPIDRAFEKKKKVSPICLKRFSPDLDASVNVRVRHV